MNNIPDITGVAAQEFIAKADMPADLVITDQQLEIYRQLNCSAVLSEPTVEQI